MIRLQYLGQPSTCEPAPQRQPRPGQRHSHRLPFQGELNFITRTQPQTIPHHLRDHHLTLRPDSRGHTSQYDPWSPAPAVATMPRRIRSAARVVRRAGDQVWVRLNLGGPTRWMAEETTTGDLRGIAGTRLGIPPFGIDVFRGALAGLVLAEAEFATDQAMAALNPTAWIGPDVTNDASFSGGRLARTTRHRVNQALARYGIAPGNAANRPYGPTKPTTHPVRTEHRRTPSQSIQPRPPGGGGGRSCPSTTTRGCPGDRRTPGLAAPAALTTPPPGPVPTPGSSTTDSPVSEGGLEPPRPCGH